MASLSLLYHWDFKLKLKLKIQQKSAEKTSCLLCLIISKYCKFSSLKVILADFSVVVICRTNFAVSFE